MDGITQKKKKTSATVSNFFMFLKIINPMAKRRTSQKCGLEIGKN